MAWDKTESEKVWFQSDLGRKLAEVNRLLCDAGMNHVLLVELPEDVSGVQTIVEYAYTAHDCAWIIDMCCQLVDRDSEVGASRRIMEP